MSEAAQIVTGQFHEAFFVKIFDQFRVFFNGNTFEEKLSSLPYFFHYCYVKFGEYLDNKLEAP